MPIIKKVTVFTNRLDWASAKLILGDTSFLKKLQEYDKDKISDALLKKLKEYIDNPDFAPETVATQSKVCKSICMWVRALYMYAEVYRVVEPKRKRSVDLRLLCVCECVCGGRGSLCILWTECSLFGTGSFSFIRWN